MFGLGDVDTTWLWWLNDSRLILCIPSLNRYSYSVLNLHNLPDLHSLSHTPYPRLFQMCNSLLDFNGLPDHTTVREILLYPPRHTSYATTNMRFSQHPWYKVKNSDDAFLVIPVYACTPQSPRYASENVWSARRSGHMHAVRVCILACVWWVVGRDGSIICLHGDWRVN